MGQGGMAEWLNGHQLSEDADEAVALQVFDWEEVRHKGKIVIKVMGPEEVDGS